MTGGSEVIDLSLPHEGLVEIVHTTIVGKRSVLVLEFLRINLLEHRPLLYVTLDQGPDDRFCVVDLVKGQILEIPM